MSEKKHSLYLTFPGTMAATQAILAYLAVDQGAAMILDTIDAAEKAGVGGAAELADHIRAAARAAGIR